jgi:hypothetical protein
MEEFLSGCIHEILYLRSLYPRQLFSKALVLNTPIHIAQPIKVADYVRLISRAIKHHLDNDNITAAHLAITSPTTGVKQVFSFCFQQIGVEMGARDGLNAYFQAFIMRLNYACVSLEPLPFFSDPDISWRVYLDLESHDIALRSASTPLALSSQEEIKIKSSYITPVHTLFTNSLKMELVVHEAS